MRVRTFALYLIGNRQAILDVAADRGGLWVGLLFVLSAGFAREYDGQDLLREPWHLLVPVGASLAASFLLFLVACGPLFLRRQGRPPFFAAYRSFLTLFWMTAPLAWLYAIPYERFLSPGAATSANLWTLALVAVWRVALITRVVSVITGRDLVLSAMQVMAFADAAALLAVYLMPKPVMSYMGGIRLTESEVHIYTAQTVVGVLGILSAPIWAVGAVVACFRGRPAWQVPANPPQTVFASRGLLGLAALSLLIWLPILPWTQAEQQLRSRVEDDMKAGRIADALDLMSAHAAADFPPQWDPPPRVGYGEKTPRFFDVMEVLMAHNCAPWVRASYVDKLWRYFEKEHDYALNAYTKDELADLLRILSQLPEGPDMAATFHRALEWRLSDSNIPAEERESLNGLLKLGAKGVRRER